MYPPSSRSQAGGQAAGVEWAAKGSPVLSPGGPHHRAGEEARGSTWHLLKTLPRPSVLPPTPRVASMGRGERAGKEAGYGHQAVTVPPLGRREGVKCQCSG